MSIYVFVTWCLFLKEIFSRFPINFAPYCLLNKLKEKSRLSKYKFHSLLFMIPNLFAQNNQTDESSTKNLITYQNKQKIINVGIYAFPVVQADNNLF